MLQDNTIQLGEALQFTHMFAGILNTFCMQNRSPVDKSTCPHCQSLITSVFASFKTDITRVGHGVVIVNEDIFKLLLEIPDISLNDAPIKEVDFKVFEEKAVVFMKAIAKKLMEHRDVQTVVERLISDAEIEDNPQGFLPELSHVLRDVFYSKADTVKQDVADLMFSTESTQLH